MDETKQILETFEKVAKSYEGIASTVRGLAKKIEESPEVSEEEQDRIFSLFMGEMIYAQQKLEKLMK